MKLPKFRVWDAWGSCYEENLIKKMIYFNLRDMDDDYIVSAGCYIHDECKIMQSSEVLDKNSKEIYEGDVVRYDNIEIDGKKFSGTSHVWFKFGSFVICMGLHTVSLCDIDEFHFKTITRLEVIGNIHEQERTRSQKEESLQVISHTGAVTSAPKED